MSPAEFGGCHIPVGPPALLHCFLHAGSCDASSALVFGVGIVLSLNLAAGQQSESGRAPCPPRVALWVLVLWEG